MTRTGTTTTTKKTYYYMRAHAMLVGLAVAALVALATVGVDPAEAAFPGANGKIVFSSDRVTSDNPTGDDEIFVMNQVRASNNSPSTPRPITSPPSSTMVIG